MSHKKISEEEEHEIIHSLPDINAFAHRVNDRRLVYKMSQENLEFYPLCWVCLDDAAYQIQTSIAALKNAKVDWKWANSYYKENTLTMSVGESRYHFDYFAMLISSATNHIAAGMWHLEEQTTKPLKRYSTAAEISRKWSAKNAKYESYSILSAILNSPEFIKIMSYRHGIVHRGMPVIKGEFRYARRKIWADPEDPPPSSFNFKIKLKDGRSTYDTLNMVPDYEMSELLECATKAMNMIDDKANEFLEVFDQRVLNLGIWTLKNDKMVWTPIKK